MNVSARIVIVGAGFAGVAVAQGLERAGKGDQLKITLINRQNFMLFTPMLPEAAAGSIEPRHIMQPLRELDGVKGTPGASSLGMRSVSTSNIAQ